MTGALQEPSGRPGSLAKDRRPEPPGFLSAFPGYRSTALLDRLRVTEYAYLDAGGHVYLDYTGAGLPAKAQLSAHAERMRSQCFGNPRFLIFVEMTYTDRSADTGGLAPRVGC